MGDNPTGAAIWRFGGVEFDAVESTLAVAGEAVDIDRSCLALLAALLEQAGEPLGKDALLEAGWPGRVVHENSLAKAIGRLRQALGDDGVRIEALYGNGYRLTGPVQRTPRPPGRTDGLNGRLSQLGARLFGSRIRTAVVLGAVLVGLSLTAAGLAVGWGWTARKEAAEQTRQVEALVDFLGSDVLSSADPYSPAFQDRSLREAIERAAATMDDRLREDAPTRVTLHRMVAEAFSNWGEYEKAVSHLDRAYNLSARLHGSRAAESVPIDIAICQNLRLAGEPRRAERICLRAEQGARASGSPHLNAARIARAKLQFEIGEYDAAAVALTEALKPGGRLSGEERADAEWFLGLSLRKLGRFEPAAGALRRHLAMRQTLHGDAHPLTAWAHADYGDFLVDSGDYVRADEQLDRARLIFDTTLGPDHPESLSPAYSRAVAHLWRGEAGDAGALLRALLERYRETLGADHFWTLYTMSELALAEAMAGEDARAAALLREARQTGARVLYGRAGKAAHFHLRWARTLAALGQADEAEAERRRAGDAMDQAFVMPDHPWRARLHCLAGQVAVARDDAAAARRAGRACLSALGAVDALPKTYPALIEARMLAGLDGPEAG
ncbi:hypothetical protein GCM10009116_13340 [Brevundimonas basaltis]|uniref:DNA-binding winged helix-turn-helix (WHTH) protein/Tfp pilus assembly protein PilF n=1 Tax=Brevundimonas basaltis TaxID=472166 RepID=A0A7W8HYF2_9CAUL|nr:tetratricopeptide repeat protein [Brevundimonas basaltis]MBB5291353.1 DNA-binding winged helix-turn-helix (wHTH) protein/Tfp pilus assembly protein PilF [Brevundimonas basaltis]